MQDMQDMMRRLNQSGKRLSKGHRKIAEYIVEHYDKAVFMTASKLGEKVGVSESTVVRFASAMGYEGYPQLQRALQELVRHWLTAVQRFEMATDINQSEVLRTVLHADMQNIRTTTEEIDVAAFDEVVDKIIAARHIYVMGLRSAAPIAQFLAYYLNFIFDNVRIVSEASGDVFEQISRINETDLLFGISFPRYSTRTLEAMNFARARGAQVTLVSGPCALRDPEGADVVRVRTAEQMLAACEEPFAQADVAVFVAAVSDWRPAQQADAKFFGLCQSGCVL